MLHQRLVYIYLFNVPSFSSRYFNKIKRTSRLGRLLALSLEILSLKCNANSRLHQVNRELALKPKCANYNKSRLLFLSVEILISLYGKQCAPRSDRSSLFWVHAVSLQTSLVSNIRQLFAADDFSRQHYQMHFFMAL